MCPAVERVADRVTGAWAFKGTRTPVRALFQNLEAGARVEEFLEWFPGVTHEQVMAVLAHAERSLTTPPRLADEHPVRSGHTGTAPSRASGTHGGDCVPARVVGAE